MDEAEALARESDVDALDIFVESVAFGLDHLARMGALARELGPAAARARRAALDDALDPRRAAVGRALGRPPLGHPPRRRRAARGVRDRRGAAPRRRADERRGDPAGPRARRRRRDLRARHRLQPRHVADRLAAGDHRPRRPSLRLERARGAARHDAQRRLRARPQRRAGLARARQARRRDRARRARRAPPLPLRPQPRRRGDRRRRARRGCGPIRRGGCGRDRAPTSCATGSPAWSRSGCARTGRTGWPGRPSWPPPRTGSARRRAPPGLRVERDPAGSLWAVPDAPGPWWATGSHLDSVRSGGRYDGALGVAAGFAAAERAARPSR